MRLRVDRQLSEDFCYMRKGAHAYDWRIVPFSERDASDYMVISQRGLTRDNGHELEFLPFEQFILEQSQFLRLRQVPFFKIFRLKKLFGLWKKYTKTISFREKSREFTAATLLVDPLLKDAVYSVREVCLKLSDFAHLPRQLFPPKSQPEFEQLVHALIAQTLQFIGSCEFEILTLLRKAVGESMDLYRKKMRLSKEAEKKVPLLIGDELGKDMPYTESATMRIHQLKLRAILRQADYQWASAKQDFFNRVLEGFVEGVA